MQRKKVLIIILIVAISLTVVWLVTEYFLLSSQLKTAESNLKIQEANQKAATFERLFIDKVLLSTGTIGFEDRLELENAVRGINDQEIFSQWQQFTNSKSNSDTQKIVGNILKLLVDKISPK